ncbi:Alpha/Beta hydrolase protein [Russula compacta]|nr:Alpha/Beta hydrolase protein [Russula compacta]
MLPQLSGQGRAPKEDSGTYNRTLKQLGDLILYIDVYPPITQTDGSVPALVYFHGGGMTVGDRASWFPAWLQKRTTAAGLVFISADYRLMPPSTGHEVLDDVVDLFAFVTRTQFPGTAQIDGTCLAVAGSSAGGMCAFLAAIHVDPKPRAVLSIYGLGGDIFSPHFLSPKTEPFFLGLEILDRDDFPDFLHPASASLAPTAQSQPAFFGDDCVTPGMPSNPRMQLARLWFQYGIYLDYWTGLHEPSISHTLRELLPKEAHHLPATACHPRVAPRAVIHGSKDTAVPTQSSRAMHARLLDAKVETTLRILEGADHSFDLKHGAEKTYGGIFDEAVEFLRAALLDV